MRYILAVLVLVAALTVIGTGPWSAGAGDLRQPWAAPELPQRGQQDWINSPPLTLEHLAGKVVLLDFWTYGCWNCTRSFPWLKQMEANFSDDDFAVVGIHTPEFEHEKDRAQVAAKVAELQLGHPVMIDNDFAYWKAMNNRYWPAFYLIDKVGQVRDVYVGETRDGDKRARAIEAAVRKLLKETT